MAGELTAAEASALEAKLRAGLRETFRERDGAMAELLTCKICRGRKSLADWGCCPACFAKLPQAMKDHSR